MANILLPKQYHPDFAVPGRKPVGAVEVDWSNPLTKKLKHIYLLQDGGGWVDLVTGNLQGSVVGADYNTYTTTHIETEGGSAARTIALPIALSSMDGFSVICGAAKVSGAVQWSILNAKWNGIYSDTDRGAIVTRSVDFSGIITPADGGVPVSEGIHQCAYTLGGVNDLRGSVNGGAISSDTSVNVPTGAFTEIKLGSAFSDNPGSGKFSYFGIYDSVLTDSDLVSLSTNPYQLLKPAEPLQYYLPPITVEQGLASLPLPKQYHPDFANTRTKPVSQVVVDWANPVTKDLKVWSQYHDITPAGVVNYADGTNPGTYLGTAMTASPIRTDRADGLATEFHPAGGINGADTVSFQDPVTHGDDFTLFADLYVQNTGGSANGRLWYRGVGNDSVRLQVRSNGIEFSYIDSSPVAQHDSSITSMSIVLNDHIRVVARKQGNVIECMAIEANGAVHTSTPTTGGSGGMRDDGAGNLMFPVGPNNGSGGHHELLSGGVWNRALSDAEAVSLLYGPYQVLAPAEPQQYFYGAAGGELPTGTDGTLNSTLGVLTAAGVGTVDVSGTEDSTLGVLTATATAEVDVTATADNTLGVLTVDASGTVVSGLVANLDVTLGVLTASATGTVDVSGTEDSTLGVLTATATGEVDVDGTLDSTLGVLTVAGQGTVATTSINGTTDVTLGVLTSTATAEVDVAGTEDSTLGVLTATASGAVSISGTTDVTLGVLTVTANGTLVADPLIEGNATAVINTNGGSLDLYYNGTDYFEVA